MNIFKIVLVVLVVVALQGAFSRYISQIDYTDLTLIVAVYLSLKRNPLQGTLVGCLAGLSYDAVVGGPLLGASGFAKTLIGFTLSTINVHFAIDRKLMRLFMVILASAVNVLIFLGLYGLFDSQASLPISSTPSEIGKLTAFQAAGNLILAFFIFPILDKVFAEEPYVGGRRARI
ncbi:MAG: rod shape-determining protein MreD [Blastocatellia bacterium]|nr:rod shape-determining protein MreD [Blastocatellia bacterium]